jgi:RimJ/RimL family protein N-acetyltransferase
MSDARKTEPSVSWPSQDPEGRPVQFSSRGFHPREDEMTPVLSGRTVRLEPLSKSHLDGLCTIGLDPEVTRLMTTPLKTRQAMEGFIDDALRDRGSGDAVPFATVLIDTGGGGRIVGTTRFGSVDAANRRMEIGWTWLGKDYQRSGVNTEAKYLMLRHAFEEWRALRVELKTDSLNAPSRAAILRIGAIQEGVFRNHVVTSEGRVRHTVYFSILAEEWPRVKSHLEMLMTRHSS